MAISEVSRPIDTHQRVPDVPAVAVLAALHPFDRQFGDVVVEQERHQLGPARRASLWLPAPADDEESSKVLAADPGQDLSPIAILLFGEVDPSHTWAHQASQHLPQRSRAARAHDGNGDAVKPLPGSLVRETQLLDLTTGGAPSDLPRPSLVSHLVDISRGRVRCTA